VEHTRREDSNVSALSFRYLDEEAMIAAGVEDMDRCVDVMEETFRLMGQGDYIMTGANGHSHGAEIDFPDESPIPGMPLNTGDDRRFTAMPAYLGGRFGTTAVKWYGSNTANRDKGLPRSIHVIIVSDADTGAPLGIMSGNLVSAMRTGAVSGLGARYLSAPDSKVLGLVGPGVMAKTAVRAFMSARPSITTIQVKGRGQATLDSFKDFVAAEFPGVTVEVKDTEEAAVRGADVVTYTNTGSTGREKYPMIQREWVKPGAFIALPSASRLDEGLERSDVRKVVDCGLMYELWETEVPRPWYDHLNLIGMRFQEMLDSGDMTPEERVELGDIVAGKAVGYQDGVISVLAIGGIPVEDVAWATDVLRSAEDKGLGIELPLWGAPPMA
jgi:ornithine cyclodeaminase